MRSVITNGTGIRTTLSITGPQSSIVRRNNRGAEHRARVAPWRRKLFMRTNYRALQNNSAYAKRGARRLPVLLFCLVVRKTGWFLLITIGQVSQPTRTACAV